MKRYSYSLMLITAIIFASLASSCARKVVLENDHRHPHIKKPHPHERVRQPEPEIRP